LKTFLFQARPFSAAYDLRRRGIGFIAEQSTERRSGSIENPLDFDSKPLRLSVCTNPKVTLIAQFSSEIVKTTAKKALISSRFIAWREGARPRAPRIARRRSLRGDIKDRLYTTA
jgi:hypothetical protein